MEPHPLFLKKNLGCNLVSNFVTYINIDSCFVSDHLGRLTRIWATPHYFLARDIVQNLDNYSSTTFYRLYRKDQFGFNENELQTDVEFFKKKILNPKFTYPIITRKKRGLTIVVDGFHRLAIAKAYGKVDILSSRYN